MACRAWWRNAAAPAPVPLPRLHRSSWLAKLEPREEMEEAMLEIAWEARDNSRLSCQIQITAGDGWAGSDRAGSPAGGVAMSARAWRPDRRLLEDEQ